MAVKILRDMFVDNKRVIVRVDYNVPTDTEGNIIDTRRIKASLPTINYLLERNCSIILMTHLGRPDGRIVESLRLDKVSNALSALVNKPVQKMDDCIGPTVEAAAHALKPKEIMLLENLRFYAEEEKNDSAFAQKLASLADVYVDDAFGTAHRAHASVAAITQFLPSCMGFLLEKEIASLSLAFSPEKPFVLLIGGAKIADKIEMLHLLTHQVDALVIGGAMANTFLKAKGKSLGNSKLEDNSIDTALSIMKSTPMVVLPVDLVCAAKPEKGSAVQVISIEHDAVPEGMMALDIGPQSIQLFKRVLTSARTVLWNGPLGYYEVAEFAKGTEEIARMLSQSSAKTIVAGGDTAAIVETLNIDGKFTHVSTGGGASLEFLSGKKLPALVAIEQCPHN